MAKGSYNVSTSGDSNIEEDGKNNSENRDCINSCLSPVFLRSLSLHDRPRSSRVPSKKELRKSRYRALVSSSLQQIPSNPTPATEIRSEYSTNIDFESSWFNSDTEENAQSSIHNESSSAFHQENEISESDSWMDKNMRFSVESGKLLEETVAILRTVDEDILESFTNLTKPESIALESVMEIYRNKDKTTTGCSAGSELDLSTESSNQPIYENWQPLSKSSVRSESASQHIYENWQPSIQKRPKHAQTHSTPRGPNNFQAQSPGRSPKIMQAQSPGRSLKIMKAQSPGKIPKIMKAESTRQNPKTMQVQPSQQSPKNAKINSTQESSNLQAYTAQQSPKNLSSEQSPKNLLAHSVQETLNCESLLISNSGNTQSLTNPDSDATRSVEQSPRNSLPLSAKSASGDTTEVKSLIEFDLPSDHEQFIKITGALQNRCLEYREMIQDIAVSALEECLNFSEPSVSRMQHLRGQFESQKSNFRDFKDLCCKSVVFGPDSLPIGEKVTEVIQSFFLKLLQEENETFMVRLEFGLKMGEVYAKMLNLEKESKKIITTLEKEILYLKKTSVGFKV